MKLFRTNQHNSSFISSDVLYVEVINLKEKQHHQGILDFCRKNVLIIIFPGLVTSTTRRHSCMFIPQILMVA